MNSPQTAEFPLFPLGTVLFPTMPVKLQIFEKRYIRMMEQCLEKNQDFGIALIRKGMEAHGPLAEIHTVGCSVKIVELERMPDGKFNLYGTGEQRFEILTENRSGEFLTGKISWKPFEKKASAAAEEDADFPAKIFSYMENLAPDRLPSLRNLIFPEDQLSRAFLATEFLQTSLTKKQELLEIPGREDFIQAVADALDHEIQLLQALKRLPQPIQNNQSLN